MTLFDDILLNSGNLWEILIKIAIAVIILSSFCLAFRRFLKFNSEDNKKNKELAFSISLGAMIFGLAIIMSGMVFPKPSDDVILNTIAFSFLYGVLGVVLLLMSRLIFDSLAFPNISIKQEIEEGNIQAATIDAANIIAISLIINAAMRWTYHNSFEGILAVIIAYILSQILMILVTYMRVWFIKFKSKGVENFKHLLHEHNAALAFRFAGHRIGTGFIIAMSINMVLHDESILLQLYATWFVLFASALFLVEILEYLTSRIVFIGTDINKAITNNSINIGICLGMIYIAICFILYQLLPAVGWLV